MNTNRRDSLKQYILEKGEVQFKELEQLYTDVSSMTIRRDLSQLEEQGFIIRTWGGVKSVTKLSSSREDIYSLRATENIEAKRIIANKAVQHIEAGRSIFIDSGTTTMCLAELLPDDFLSIFTTGPNIALEAIKHKNPSISLIGGQLSRDNLTTSGSNALNFLKTINIDIAFMATSGFSLKSGFTIGNFDECELKKTAMKKARKVILLMDDSKIDRNMPYTFATLKDIDMLVCNTVLPEPILKSAEKYEVSIY